MSSVTTSRSSRRTARTRATAGTSGWWMAAPSGIALSRAAVDIHDLQPRQLQPRRQNRHEALHQLVAEIVVLLRLAAQALGVDGKRAGELERLRVEAAPIGRHKPRDAHDLALAQGLEDDGPTAGRVDL